MTTSRPSVPAISLPFAFRLVWSSTLLLALLGLLFCIVSAHHFHRHPQHFLLTSPDLQHFGDFTIYLYKFRLLHTAGFFTHDFPFTYPAPVAVVYNFFYRYTGPHPTRAFLVFFLLALLVPVLCFARALARDGVQPLLALLFSLTLLVCSWPAILAFERGNMEILVWLTLVVGTWAWATGRLYLAAACFALAAALKLFPFVFFGLFLSVRDVRRILFGAAVFLVVSVASLAYVGPTVPAAFSGIHAGLNYFGVRYMSRWQPIEATGDHSLFNLYKTTAVLVFHHSTSFLPSLGRFLPVAAVLGIVLYILRIRFLPLLNQLLCLCIASIYFTAFSGDGTLLHLYYPFALLLFLALGRTHARLSNPPGLLAILVTLTLILTPEPYLILVTRFGRERVDGPVHAILLAILLTLSLVFPLGPSLAEFRRSRRPLLQALLHPSRSSSPTSL